MGKIINYLTEEFVLVAPSRMNRPNNYKNKYIESAKITNCPFCEVKHNELEKVLYKNYDNSCIILKNKYPAIETDDTSHEVVIDSKDHDVPFDQNTLEHMKEVFIGVKIREKQLFFNNNIKCVQVFKNFGALAGASLEHSHMQIIALDYIPKKLQTISKNMSRYRKENDECYICSLKENKDIFTVYENETFKVVTKIDTLMCYTVDILPKRHVKILNNLTDNEIVGLCDAIKTCLGAIKNILQHLSYNMVLYNSPRDKNINDDYHMFLQIIPRLHGHAGFEVSTNNFINSVDPQEYANKLKNAIKKQ